MLKSESSIVDAEKKTGITLREVIQVTEKKRLDTAQRQRLKRRMVAGESSRVDAAVVMGSGARGPMTRGGGG